MFILFILKPLTTLFMRQCSLQLRKTYKLQTRHNNWVLPNVNNGCHICHPNGARLAPNGTNVGLFRSVSASQSVLKLILQSPRISHLVQTDPFWMPNLHPWCQHNVTRVVKFGPKLDKNWTKWTKSDNSLKSFFSAFWLRSDVDYIIMSHLIAIWLHLSPTLSSLVETPCSDISG